MQCLHVCGITQIMELLHLSSTLLCLFCFRSHHYKQYILIKPLSVVIRELQLKKICYNSLFSSSQCFPFSVLI